MNATSRPLRWSSFAQEFDGKVGDDQAAGRELCPESSLSAGIGDKCEGGRLDGGIVADEEELATGSAVVGDDLAIVAARRLVEAGHDADDHGLGELRLERGEGLAGTARRRAEDPVGEVVACGNGFGHQFGGTDATWRQRPVGIGDVRGVPGRFGVPKEEEAKHLVGRIRVPETSLSRLARKGPLIPKTKLRPRRSRAQSQVRTNSVEAYGSEHR